jgi:hypothetical protein
MLLKFINRCIALYKKERRAEKAFEKYMDYLEEKPSYMMTDAEKQQLKLLMEIMVIEDILEMKLSESPIQELDYELKLNILKQEVRFLCSADNFF